MSAKADPPVRKHTGRLPQSSSTVVASRRQPNKPAPPRKDQSLVEPSFADIDPDVSASAQLPDVDEPPAGLGGEDTPSQIDPSDLSFIFADDPSLASSSHSTPPRHHVQHAYFDAGDDAQNYAKHFLRPSYDGDADAYLFCRPDDDPDAEVPNTKARQAAFLFYLLDKILRHQNDGQGENALESPAATLRYMKNCATHSVREQTISQEYACEIFNLRNIVDALARVRRLLGRQRNLVTVNEAMRESAGDARRQAIVGALLYQLLVNLHAAVQMRHAELEMDLYTLELTGSFETGVNTALPKLIVAHQLATRSADIRTAAQTDVVLYNLVLCMTTMHLASKDDSGRAAIDHFDEFDAVTNRHFSSSAFHFLARISNDPAHEITAAEMKETKRALYDTLFHTL